MKASLLIQLQNDLLFEKQTNRTREFLLQEQEKENWRELERTQKAEKDMRNELEDTIKNKSALSEELSGVKKQYEWLVLIYDERVISWYKVYNTAVALLLMCGEMVCSSR